ncbi:Pycsar system effector family protein [Arthrobacter sp. OAP107]|uniref:Pycsar system effector family protein n=1 Tax=Arthrobacter sp. OAP107 TaxID=3156445 RepID=UPI0033925B4A
MGTGKSESVHVSSLWRRFFTKNIRLTNSGSDETGAERTKDALSYCRQIYASTLDWYKVADQKGQLLLTLNGVLVTVSANAILRSASDVEKMRQVQSQLTWVLTLSAAATIGFSIVCAMLCLRSRLSNARIDRYLSDFKIGEKYQPVATFWFGTLAHMPEKVGVDMLQNATSQFELEATSREIMLLSQNVLRKHRWVNLGWLSAGAGLLLLISAMTSIVYFAG